jgi:serine/threonine protein phosphatase 1
MSRHLAIGDIHGCRAALDHLLNFVRPRPQDLIITVGDYIDRGPDSRGVLDRLVELKLNTQLIPLRGNHELMMLAAKQGGRHNLRSWLTHGGVETLESYAPPGEEHGGLHDIPTRHWAFVENACIDWYETENHLFVHAGVNPDLPMEQQTSEWLHWQFLQAQRQPHQSGKITIVGHSEQRDGIPKVQPGYIAIDTFAYGLEWLTCLDPDSGEYWQANELGHTRQGMLDLELAVGK